MRARHVNTGQRIPLHTTIFGVSSGVSEPGKWGIGFMLPNTKTQRAPALPLTDAKIRNARPKAKPYKLIDGGGGGLYVHVTPKGAKLWRQRYEYNGKEKLLS